MSNIIKYLRKMDPILLLELLVYLLVNIRAFYLKDSLNFIFLSNHFLFLIILAYFSSFDCPYPKISFYYLFQTLVQKALLLRKSIHQKRIYQTFFRQLLIHFLALFPLLL